MLLIDDLPKVSVIIPTFNRAGFIAQTIESVRAQTYPCWELIVVDDGSEDDTEKIVNAFRDDRIHYFKTKHTGIGGILKNIGITKSSGLFIAFLDSDDLWAADKIEKQVQALLDYPEAGFCLTNGYNFRTLYKPLDFFYKQKEGIKYDNLFLSCFKSEVAGFTQALMVRKKCIDVVGRFREVKSFSDIDFIISLSKHSTGVILYEPLVFRRLHDTNYISNTWEKSYYEGVEIIHRYKKDLPRQIFSNALFRLHINFGEDCLGHHKKLQAINNFIQAWKCNPLSISPLKKIIKTLIKRS